MYWVSNISDNRNISGQAGGKELDVKDDGQKEKKASDQSFKGFQESMDDLVGKYEKMRTYRPLHSKLEQDAISRIRTQCINYLLWILLGEKGSKPLTNDTVDALPSQGMQSGQLIVQGNTLTAFHIEQEETTFSTEGKVITADGRELKFGLTCQMSRSFEEYYQERLTSVEVMCDPLVINLDSNVASVSDQKIRFDIDADGEMDEISRLGEGSGFLALDRNGDGIINDGSELFGTKSGDGFKDLAKYDSDGNGWIDEADEIWSKLRIYTQDENGKQSLYSLSQKGVGAVFLGNVDTDFSLKSTSTNQVNAAIRKTGIFLYENGNAGTMQHVDFAN